MHSTTNSSTTQNHQDLAARAAFVRDRVNQTFKEIDQRWHLGDQLPRTQGGESSAAQPCCSASSAASRWA